VQSSKLPSVGASSLQPMPRWQSRSQGPSSIGIALSTRSERRKAFCSRPRRNVAWFREPMMSLTVFLRFVFRSKLLISLVGDAGLEPATR
jgi:hypothetical protein